MPTSPFGPSTSTPGRGTVHLKLLPPSTPTLSNLSYTYPLKLLPSTPHLLSPPVFTSTSDPTTSDSNSTAPTTVPLLFILTYGGGLLPPDSISLVLHLDASTRLTLATQGSTKIYKSPSPHLCASQDLHSHISRHAGLWLGPDPTQPFRGSWYAQKQVFEVEEGGSLGLVDWVTEGRRARGEEWCFGGWSGKNEVWRISGSSGGGDGEVQGKRRLVLRDNVVLDGDKGGEMHLVKRMDGMGIFGTVICMGPLFESLGQFFVDEFKRLPRIGGRDWGDGYVGELGNKEKRAGDRWRVEKDDGVLWTAASVRGLVLVKFGAREVEGARKWLGWMLREEGSLGREFGEGALMCVK